jgi:Flp pilus assembly protein TadG
MKKRFQHLRDNERGMSLVFVAVGFMSFLTATTLAIDVGMFMTSRNQAQNAADAGALAGAVALVQNSYTDRTPSGPAVQSAIQTAKDNLVIGGEVTVEPANVTFPVGPGGQNNRVRVEVFRPGIATLMGRFFGVDTVDMTAVATAEASPANAATCVKPFTIPDRWTEKQTAPWDPMNDTFDYVDNKGNVIANPDIYIPVGQKGYTGYDPVKDKGLEIRLKSDNSTKVAPSFYNPWRIGNSSGSDDYRWNIAECNTAVIPIGADMPAEPGNMVGPTTQGVQDLIDKDPNAYWDQGCNCVKGSAFGSKSPRVGVIPVYDPVVYELGKHNSTNASLKIANYIGIFVEGMQGNEVIGRITTITGLLGGEYGPAPEGAFPMVIRLVQ